MKLLAELTERRNELHYTKYLCLQSSAISNRGMIYENMAWRLRSDQRDISNEFPGIL